MYLVAVVTEIFAALLAAGLLFLTDWPPRRILLVGLPVLLAFCLWSFPLSKAVWAAVEFATDAASGDAEKPGYRERAYGDKTAPGSETTPR